MKSTLLQALSASAGIVSAAFLLIELRHPDPAFPSPPAEALPAAHDFRPEAAPELALTELGAHPLFTPGRRPVAVETPAPPVPPTPSPSPPPPPPPPPEAGAGLTLLGILNGPDGRIAVIGIKSSGDIQRLEEGKAADRWQVRQILRDHVMLSIEGATQRLDFPPPTEGRSKTGGTHAPSQSALPPPRRP